MGMARDILLLCLAGGVCALDSTAVWQLMLSQPLVSSTIAGLVLGAPEVGIFVGIVLQLVWSGAVPVGARPMPDAPVGSLSGVWFAATLLETNGFASPSFCYLLGVISALCIALVGRHTILIEREISRKLFRGFIRRASAGEKAFPERVVAAAVAIAFARGFILCLLALVALALIARLLARNPAFSARDYGLTLLIIEALGAGVLFSVFVRRSRTRVLAFAGGLVWAFLVMNLSQR